MIPLNKISFAPEKCSGAYSGRFGQKKEASASNIPAEAPQNEYSSKRVRTNKSSMNPSANKGTIDQIHSYSSRNYDIRTDDKEKTIAIESVETTKGFT